MRKQPSRLWHFLLLAICLSIPSCNGQNAVPISTIRTSSFGPLATFQSSVETGAAIYVAPDGSPRGKGTKKRPWDLQTALSQPDGIKPGDTIYLRGGTYNGKFTSKLAGSESSPITVRSYPGEWAKIDGYVTTAATSSVPGGANGTDALFTVADGSKFKEGDQITIRDEQFYVRSSNNNTVTAIHGWNGTPTSSHPSGSLVVLGGNQLEINGAYTIYRDFEITNSDPVRSSPTPNSQNAPDLRGEGVFHAGPRTKLINLVIHDCQEGIFTNQAAVDSEIYGCIIYNNGYVAGGAANGHGIYVINDQPSKRIIDSICFNNFSIGIKSVSQNGDSKYIHHEGDVVFNNGSVTEKESGVRHPGIFVGANNGTADQNTITRCFFYQPVGAVGGNARIGFSGTNGSLVFTENFVMGGAQALDISNCEGLTVFGNTFYITDLNPQSQSNAFLVLYASLAGASVNWDNNSYYNGRTVSNANAFYIDFSNSQGFSDWRSKSGFDANSNYSLGVISGLQVFVRPNQYDANRAHIIVYNWDRADVAKVDVSEFLQRGQRYEVRNVQNFFGPPALSGKYKGKPLKLPMSGLSVASPIGYDYTPAHTGPEFNTFVLIRN